MKLSKTLLQAILLGATVGATTSCGLFAESDEVVTEKCSEKCDFKCKAQHQYQDKVTYTPSDCPACGLG